MTKTMTNKIIILKGVGLAMLFVVTVIGCNAHFNQDFLDFMKEIVKTPGCKALSDCPNNVLSLERTFVALSIICLIVSAVSLIATFVLDMSKFKLPDAGWHVLAALLLFISGCVIIAAAVRIDNFINDTINTILPGVVGVSYRKAIKFADKIAAGVLAFITAVVYGSTGFIIFKS